MQDVFDRMDVLGAHQPTSDTCVAPAAVPTSGDGGAFTSEDIELALQEAEQLLDRGSCPLNGCHEHAEQWARQQQAGLGATASVAAHSGAAASLHESAINLRLMLHEKELELLELRAQCHQLAECCNQAQRQLQAGLEERDACIAALEDRAAQQDADAACLSQKLAAYGGLSPDAVARLQSDNAALLAGKHAAEQAAAEAERRRQEASSRVAQSLVAWERVQAELQSDNTRLAAEVERQRAELADLFQEKEVYRARAAMLEARAGAGAALPAAGPAQPGPSGHEVGELRGQLASALERLSGRDAAAKKYKEAVRALKRRTAELEQQLAMARSSEAAAVARAQEGNARTAAALQQCEQQLAEARHQGEQLTRRLVHAEGELKKAEFERAQWEWRTQDAEQRAQATSDAAEASGAAAVSLAQKQRAAAESRAADHEAQAKAASLKVLQLEKVLASVQQELEALRQRQGAADEAAARHECKLLQQQVSALRAKLATAEQEVCSKAAALAAADKRLRTSQQILQRLAAKTGG